MLNKKQIIMTSFFYNREVTQFLRRGFILGNRSIFF